MSYSISEAKDGLYLGRVSIDNLQNTTQPKVAWLVYDHSSFYPVVLASQNVDSVVNAGTAGSVVVTFPTGFFPDSNYIMSGSATEYPGVTWATGLTTREGSAERDSSQITVWYATGVGGTFYSSRVAVQFVHYGV